MRHPLPTHSLFAPLRLLSAPARYDAEDAACDDRLSEVCEVEPAPPAVDLPRTYVCPGEKHAIPRSIHLARLAAFYPNCRQCEHRNDTGQLPRSKVGRLELSARRVEPESPFRDDGIRGAYLNQLTRQSAAKLAAAVAYRLWADQPLLGINSVQSPEATSPASCRGGGPTVVVGQDSRASSPDLCVGLSESLRRMGCEVVDVGRVSRPCLIFAVDHLLAAGGLYVTGSGCPDSWTGIDVIGAGGIPWSKGGTLDEIEGHYRRGVSRSTRQGGSQRFFDAAVPYRANLLKHFQEISPLRVVCACPEAAVIDSLTSLFDGLPCEFVLHPLALVKGGGTAGREPDAAGIGETIRQASADCGVFIGEDGASLRLFTRDGRPAPLADLLRRLLRRAGQVRSAVPVTADAVAACRETLAGLGFAAEAVGTSSEAVARWMHENSPPLGFQSGERIWFRDTFPQCDALVTLGRVLRTFRSDESDDA
ncbi:MAG: hypothetical protein AB7U20_07545 [Planctomycetaceae bacterium]